MFIQKDYITISRKKRPFCLKNPASPSPSPINKKNRLANANLFLLTHPPEDSLHSASPEEKAVCPERRRPRKEIHAYLCLSGYGISTSSYNVI